MSVTDISLCLEPCIYVVIHCNLRLVECMVVFVIYLLFQCLSGKSWQHKGRSVDVLVVVLVDLLLFLPRPAAKRLLQVAVRILAADHEANLTGWVGRDCRVGIFDVGEDLLAVGFEFGDQRQMKPLVFS